MSGVRSAFALHQVDQNRALHADWRPSFHWVNCFATLHSNASLTLIVVRESTHLTYSSNRLQNATLHIQSARSYDEGMYMCQATNQLGESHSTAILKVAGILHTSMSQQNSVYFASSQSPQWAHTLLRQIILVLSDDDLHPFLTTHFIYLFFYQ